MTSQEQILRGDWKQLKGMIKDKWGQLTHDDLDRVKGNVDQLVGLIHKKTGESRETIENALESFASDSSAMLASAGNAVRNAASYVGGNLQSASNYAMESAQSASDEALQQLQDGYTQTKRAIASRPTESMAVVFGVGLVTGLVTALLMRSR